MKKLEAKEFRRYLEVACESPKPDNWDLDSNVVEAFASTGAMATFVQQNLKCLVLLGPESAFCSVWLTAFQMGREFESRRREESELKKIMKK